MRFISHRGNINGPDSDLENNPDYVLNALRAGFDVEVDMRFYLGKMYLGHDAPQYQITDQWLYAHSNNLWIHCKDSEALSFCIDNGLHCFFHNIDAYTITSRGFVWAYPGINIASKLCICVMPENYESQTSLKIHNYYGACSDYVFKIERDFNA